MWDKSSSVFSIIGTLEMKSIRNRIKESSVKKANISALRMVVEHTTFHRHVWKPEMAGFSSTRSLIAIGQQQAWDGRRGNQLDCAPPGKTNLGSMCSYHLETHYLLHSWVSSDGILAAELLISVSGLIKLHGKAVP